MLFLLQVIAILVFTIIQTCQGETSKFVISDEKVTFFEGFARCKQYNMNPLEIQSAKEQSDLEAALPTIEAGWEYGYWLFATNLGNKQTFIWVNSGRPLLFTKFNVNEPNNANAADENCLEILNVAGGSRNFKWNDVPCDKKLKFICQTRQRSYQLPNSGDFADF